MIKTEHITENGIIYKVQFFSNGSKQWFLNGNIHRENGPAVEFPKGAKFWFFRGKHHREKGPAVVFADGGAKWWINDKNVSQNKHSKLVYKIKKKFCLVKTGDILKNEFIILKKFDLPVGRIFLVYNMKEKLIEKRLAAEVC